MQTHIEFISGSLDLQSSLQCFSQLPIPQRATGILYGQVDRINQGQEVKGIFYDIHLQLAKKIGEEIAQQTISSNPGLFGLYFAHSYDFVKAGEMCTLLIVSTDNWVTANNSLSLFIQKMKKNLPIWKLEHYQNNELKWLMP